jgi:hypothetical protein
VRFREIDERIFDKRINDLRREIQNKAKSELPPEAKEPQITEITTSNGFPTAMVLLTGQADDELLRARARQFKNDIERLAGVDQSSPPACATRNCRSNSPGGAANRAACRRRCRRQCQCRLVPRHLRRQGRDRRQETRTEWLVRVVGQSADPELIAGSRCRRRGGRCAREPVPLGQVAEVSRGRATARQPRQLRGPRRGNPRGQQEEPDQHAAAGRAAERLHCRAKSALLPPRACSCNCSTTRRCRRARRSRHGANACTGLVLVLAICWLFLGSRIALLVGLGIPFSLAGTFRRARRDWVTR